MARQYVLTEKELDDLVRDLEFEKLKLKEEVGNSVPPTVNDIHRRMHYVVVKWVQDVAGYRGK